MDADTVFEEVQGHNKNPARVSFKILTGIFLVCLIINLLWQKGEITGLTQGLFFRDRDFCSDKHFSKG